MTQVVSPSSRRARRDQDARHATHQHHPATSLSPGTARGRHATPRGQNFPRILTWTMVGAIVPGSGLVASGRRALGGFIVTASVLVLAVSSAAFVVVRNDPQLLTRQMDQPSRLLLLAAILAALLLAWAIVVLGTHSAARRYGDLTGAQRLLASVLVTALIGVVAAPTIKAGGNVLIARDLLTSVFGKNNAPVSAQSKHPNSSNKDPWADTPRVNILLMGGDSGADRVGIRPDTMIVASINTKTGNSVLFSLPRNLQHVPFPTGSPQATAYPDGFYCYNESANTNTECLLNALWTWGEENKSLYYKGDSHPGLTATVEGIQELTGLRIDDYVMLNLRGFEQFIDAMGGLTINVRQRLPIGGSSEHPVASSWIEPGRRHLSGYYSLWFARSRWSTDDFDRMRRQRCVIGAVVQQANPIQLAIQFPKVAAAMKENLQTSIPLEDVDAWVNLALRVKKAHVVSVAFTNQVISTTNPDVEKMHELVQEAINPPPATSPSASPSSSAPTKKKKVVETGTPQDVSAVC